MVTFSPGLHTASSPQVMGKGRPLVSLPLFLRIAPPPSALPWTLVIALNTLSPNIVTSQIKLQHRDKGGVGWATVQLIILAIFICRLFYDGHSDRCEVAPHCSLISFSLIISNAENLFICLLVICMFSLEKCLFRPADFLNWVFLLLLFFSSMSCYHILESKYLSVTSFAKIFSQSVGCLFILFMVSLIVQKL